VAEVQRDHAVYGLDGQTGHPLWRNQSEGDGVPLFAGPHELPRLVSTRPGRDTVCRLSLEVGPANQYRLPAGETRPYETPADDPRLVRPLPWEGMAQELLPARWLIPPGLCLAVLVVPFFLARAAVRQRSWRRGLWLGIWLGLLSLGILLYRAEFGLLDRHDPLYQSVLIVVTFAAFGLPFVVFASLAASWAFRRRWRRLALLLSLFLLSMAAFAGLTLAFDFAKMDPEQHHSAAGLEYLWLPGVFFAGSLIVLGYLLAGAVHLARRGYRRALTPG
jgi:hypothetical protein